MLGIAALPEFVEVFAWTRNRSCGSKSCAGSVSSPVQVDSPGKQGGLQ